MKMLAAAVATAALLACAKGDEANKPGADSTARNLTIAQPESGAALRDVPAKAPVVETKTPTPLTKKTPPPPRKTVSQPGALRMTYAAPNRGAKLYHVVCQSGVPCGASVHVSGPEP